MATIAITGAAGGIGRATTALLEKEGHRVIGVDLRDADVEADLSTPDGRLAMLAGVTELSGGTLDGVIAGAGVMDAALAVSVNYFGAVATLEGLRPLLTRSPNASAIAISSNSTTTTPGLTSAVVDACLAGDETRANALAPEGLGLAYAMSKLALARWVRRNAVTADWIGAGIRLNAICPGVIETPMTKDSLEFIMGIPEVFPVPVHRPGRAEEVAGLLAYLLSADAAFFCGSVIIMDGGTDAAVRADSYPTARP
ncbi:MAG TPA: SDR family oxidoreductase [Acidimicrobiia bacterium]|nr:SDR family oxidoreductase [Acidimicrobiia bacterium]